MILDLRELGDVTIERNRGIVSVVGYGLSDGGNAMACALTAIGDIRVHMLSLSSSGINLTVVVDGEQVTSGDAAAARRVLRLRRHVMSDVAARAHRHGQDGTRARGSSRPSAAFEVVAELDASRP